MKKEKNYTLVLIALLTLFATSCASTKDEWVGLTKKTMPVLCCLVDEGDTIAEYIDCVTAREYQERMYQYRKQQAKLSENDKNH